MCARLIAQKMHLAERCKAIRNLCCKEERAMETFQKKIDVFCKKKSSRGKRVENYIEVHEAHFPVKNLFVVTPLICMRLIYGSAILPMSSQFGIDDTEPYCLLWICSSRR